MLVVPQIRPSIDLAIKRISRIEAMFAKLAATWSACAEAPPDLLLVTKVRPFDANNSDFLFVGDLNCDFSSGRSTESPLCPPPTTL